jgi:importin subunit beta-1
MEKEFIKYMSVFQPILLQGLSNHEEYQVCIVAVGVVGDLCRALENQMINYSDDIIRCLLHNLRNPNIHRQVKPPVLSCLGDIALAVGGNFDKYLEVTVTMLLQAQNVCSVVSPEEDDDTIDYINQLRESILEAYSGIIQGLNDANKANMLIQYVPGIVHFLESLASCVSKDDSVLKHAVGVVGDLAHAIGAPAAQHLKPRTLIQNLIREGLRSSDDQTKETAEWAKGVVKHL